MPSKARPRGLVMVRKLAQSLLGRIRTPWGQRWGGERVPRGVVK